MSQSDEKLEPKWYVVHTYSGYENKVKTDLEKTVKNRELEDFFFDIVVPMEEQIEIRDGKRVTNLKKVFPGYVLVKMIVTEIRNMGFEVKAVNVDYEVNDNIKVLSGPLENFTGVVQEINKEKNKVKVLISMFGRETPVELEFNQVQKI